MWRIAREQHRSVAVSCLCVLRISLPVEADFPKKASENTFPKKQARTVFRTPLPLCLLYGSTVIHIILLLFFWTFGASLAP